MEGGSPAWSAIVCPKNSESPRRISDAYFRQALFVAGDRSHGLKNGGVRFLTVGRIRTSYSPDLITSVRTNSYIDNRADGKHDSVIGTKPGGCSLQIAGEMKSEDKQLLEELPARHTSHDSVVAYHDVCGAGTYDVEVDTYTETTEYSYYRHGKKDQDLLPEENRKRSE